MKQKPAMELADIKKIAHAAEAEALKCGLSVSIAVVDDGGHLLWLQRLDGAPPMTPSIAIAKAHAAALGRRETKGFEDMINGGRASFLSVPGIKGLVEGGIPVMSQGTVVGAVGVSGAKSVEDAQIAKVGAAALEQS